MKQSSIIQPIAALPSSNQPETGQARRIWQRFARNRGAVVGLVLLTLICLMTLASSLVAPYDPLAQNPAHSLNPPDQSHLFGTDLLGRDVLSRVIVGSRQSLLVGFVAIALASTIGTLLGLFSGFYEGWFDTLIQRLIDILLAFPGLLLALGIVSVLGPGLLNAMFAVGISLIPSYARTVRGSVLSVKHNPYIEAARVVGCRDSTIIRTHLLPNIFMPILVLSTVGFAWAILIGASLSFLGLGAQPPFAEWGRDLSEGRNYMSLAWWISTFPGLAIMITIVSINLLGDGLRDAFDARLQAR
jgi:peptide/nickel transport system permease protein